MDLRCALALSSCHIGVECSSKSKISRRLYMAGPMHLREYLLPCFKALPRVCLMAARIYPAERGCICSRRLVNPPFSLSVGIAKIVAKSRSSSFLAMIAPLGFVLFGCFGRLDGHTELVLEHSTEAAKKYVSVS